MKNKNSVESLSSVTSGVEVYQLPPIHQKRLLAFVNHFILTTVSFLNKFAQTCERKLLTCDQKMQKLEAELCILEAKLNSIPGLEEEVRPAVVQVIIANDITDQPSNDPSPASSNPADELSQFAESESSTPSAAKDPELVRFFKMVQFGVPVPAVKSKMKQEGFDPNLLDS